jgi:hypothetical protein
LYVSVIVAAACVSKDPFVRDNVVVVWSPFMVNVALSTEILDHEASPIVDVNEALWSSCNLGEIEPTGALLASIACTPAPRKSKPVGIAPDDNVTAV